MGTLAEQVADRLPGTGVEQGGRTDESARPIALDAVVRGAKGGLIATAVMTVYRLPAFRALPPTAEFWAQYVGGGEPEAYPLEGLALHALYGTAAGAAFGPVFAAIADRLPDRREPVGIASGAVYGALLSAFGSRVLLDRLLDLDLEPDEALVFHVGHLIYGLTLGTWLGSRKPLGDVYDRD